jgi:hypothetical protein
MTDSFSELLFGWVALLQREAEKIHENSFSGLLTRTDAYIRSTVAFVNRFSRVDRERSAPEEKK